MDVTTAKQFLVSKIVEQAQRDGVALSDLEMRMVLFSEISDPAQAKELSAEFDGKYDTDEYEAKIAELFRHAYAQAKENLEQKREWEDALQAVRAEDFYGLVMVDMAKIPRPKSSLALLKAFGPLLKAFGPREILLGLFVLSMIAIAAGLVSDRFRFARPLPDWERLVLAGLCIGAMWQAGNILKRPKVR